MERIKSPDELELFRKSILERKDSNKPCITVCASTGCRAFGADKITQAFKRELEEKGLENSICLAR